MNKLKELLYFIINPLMYILSGFSISTQPFFVKMAHVCSGILAVPISIVHFMDKDVPLWLPIIVNYFIASMLEVVLVVCFLAVLVTGVFVYYLVASLFSDLFEFIAIRRFSKSGELNYKWLFNYDVEDNRFKRKGKFHRLDGPAIISDGYVEYWLYGNKYKTIEDYCKGLLDLGISKETVSLIRLQNQ